MKIKTLKSNKTKTMIPKGQEGHEGCQGQAGRWQEVVSVQVHQKLHYNIAVGNICCSRVELFHAATKCKTVFSNMYTS